jgi:cardiolipin synthase
MATTAADYPVTLLVHIAFVLVGLLIYVMGTHASGQRRHPSAALAWVLTITLLPYVGLPLYILLGTRKFPRPMRKAPPAWRSHAADLQSCAIATLEGMGLAPPMANQEIRFHRNGQAAWDELVALISGAQRTLDICTFLLANDATGKRVMRLLEERALSGVRVRLLLDAFGSWGTSRVKVRRLRAAGVELHWYRPLLHNPLRGQVNLRNHRKLVIADNQRLWSGGRNLATEYFTGGKNQPPWIDLSFSIDGPLAEQAQDLFNSQWPPDQSEGAAGNHKAVKALPAGTSIVTGTVKHLAQMVPSGPDQSEDTFYDLLLTALYRAEQRVRAVTPYFVPDDALLTALCLAARRGVQVELVVPRHSNHRLADIARARALRDLVAAGGRVFLAPGMVHAKAILVDGALALGGSLNLDSRSLFLNFELMMAFYSSEDISALSHWMDVNFSNLTELQPVQPSLLRDTSEGLVRWLGFQI